MKGKTFSPENILKKLSDISSRSFTNLNPNLRIKDTVKIHLTAMLKGLTLRP